MNKSINFIKISVILAILLSTIIFESKNVAAQISVVPNSTIINTTQFNIMPAQMGGVGFGGGGKFPKQTVDVEQIQANKFVPEIIKKEQAQVQSESSAQYIDPKVLNEFNKSSEVAVIVEVRDTSGIDIAKDDTIERQIVKDQLRMEFLRNKTNTVLATLPETEFRLKRKFLLGGFSGSTTKEGFDKLVNDSNIAKIYLNGISYTGLDVSRPLINADDVETAGYTGTYQTVCVIDSGINYTHQALGGCLGSGCKIRSGWDYINDDSEPDDETGHGTNMAGIIASEDSTYRGIAPDADLIALKVCDPGGCPNDAIKEALNFCYVSRNLYNITVASMSIYDHGQYPPNCPSWADTEINNLYKVGIPFITISGNDGHTNGISYPGCSANATPVGAVYDKNIGSITWPTVPCTDSTTTADKITCSTNRKSGVLHLLAPGCEINSTKKGSGFSPQCGTSQAAPHVSGTVAILKQLNKSLSPDDIETILKNTGVSIGDYKRVDALAAVNYVRDSDSDTYTSEVYGGNDCNDGNAGIHPGAGEVCDEIDNDCDDVIDEGCTNQCTESGYEQCFQSSYGDCITGIAINRYENVNTIRWGAVNDSSDPYVINEYKIGWKTRGGKKAYYGNLVNETCQYGGCDANKEVSLQGTKVTVTAPGTANYKETLSYNDTASYACWTWFYNFNPNYGSDNLVYVLKCFQDSDCSTGYFCNKAGSWSAWDCVAKYANGQSCTSDSVCQSNYCDNDGVGLSDDNWCFTPYSTYFDGQETSYCEYATDNGIADCDERQVGEDLNKCVGTSYYEEECSSACNYQDVTSVFECTESGCSCSEPLCDGGTTGTAITTCAANKTYFADKCASTASGEDRSDNICRSSAFASGCTASSQCNGVTAGTTIAAGSCSQTCFYDAFPNVTLVSPQDGNISSTGNVVFNCSAIDDYNLTNMTLYHNITGFWLANETKSLTGTVDSKNFTINELPDGINFIWNCLAYDNASQIDWADTNYTVITNIPEMNITISSLSEVSSFGTYKVFEAIILNNGEISFQNVTWTLSMGDGTVINGTRNAGLVVNESMILYAEYNYSSQGNYVVIANATALSQGVSAMQILEVSAGALSVSNFSVINSSGTLRTFEAYLKNYMAVNMTNVSWSLNTGNGIVSSALPVALQPQEVALVFVQYNYTSAGAFAANFTAVNGSWSDLEALDVTVT